MITGQLRFAPRYFGAHPGLQKALEFLMNGNFDWKVGRHDIDGNKVFALFQEYDTNPAETYPWETHDYHFDVHYLVEGEELVGYGPREGSKVVKPRNVADDYDIVAAIDNPDYMKLTGDKFVVLFPEEAHQPRIISGKSAPVKKICIKVMI